VEAINLIIAGVGGQGNVVASEILAMVFSRQGYYVSVGETFGASQRGGSVMSHVRVANEAPPGPLIPKGQVDIVVGFEPLEALRVLADYGQETSRVLVNPRPIHPLAVQIGETSYPDPEELLTTIRELAAAVLVVQGTELARQAGDVRAQNVAMVGALVGSAWLEIRPEAVEEIMAERFSDDLLSLNCEAFRLGLEAARTLAMPQ
jgi:indolepyruvate ferredoxin oxidoreductase beta subunit